MGSAFLLTFDAVVKSESPERGETRSYNQVAQGGFLAVKAIL